MAKYNDGYIAGQSSVNSIAKIKYVHHNDGDQGVLPESLGGRHYTQTSSAPTCGKGGIYDLTCGYTEGQIISATITY